MEKESVEARVKAIIAEKFRIPVDQITSQSTFAELQADSLAVIDLLLTVEDTFLVTIPDIDGRRIKTMQELVEQIHQRLPG
jgi:acyl carrier protein